MVIIKTYYNVPDPVVMQMVPGVSAEIETILEIREEIVIDIIVVAACGHIYTIPTRCSNPVVPVDLVVA